MRATCASFAHDAHDGIFIFVRVFACFCMFLHVFACFRMFLGLGIARRRHRTPVDANTS